MNWKELKMGCIYFTNLAQSNQCALFCFFFQVAAKRLMTQLPSSSWVNTTEAPRWLLHAVTWEWRSTVALTRWIWAPQRPACHSANRSICSETQYGHLGCALEETPGEPVLASQLSLVALSVFIFQCEATLRRERLKEEARFHRRFKGAIKHAALSEIIQHFDIFIVCSLIYGVQSHNIFMFLCCCCCFFKVLWNMIVFTRIILLFAECF